MLQGMLQIAVVMVIDRDADLYDGTNGYLSGGLSFMVSSHSWQLHKSKHMTC